MQILVNNNQPQSVKNYTIVHMDTFINNAIGCHYVSFPFPLRKTNTYKYIYVCVLILKQHKKYNQLLTTQYS